MIEARATIENIQDAKVKVESLGAEFKGEYAFKDIIFSPKKWKVNLNNDFIRLRVLSKNQWPTKNVILVRKKTEWSKTGKKDNLLLRQEFDTEKEAQSFIEKNLREYKKSFEYPRVGWQYQFGKHRIFIEEIENFEPSIEIEADNEKELEELFEKIGIKKTLKESVPEIMHKICH